MLTEGAINNLLKITSTNALDTSVDYNLQIINLNLQSKQNNYTKDFDLYTCSLGDSLYVYSGFILPVKKDKQNPKSGDIIKITKISTSKLTYNGCKIIIIKKYDIIQKNSEIKNNLINVESYEDIQNKIKEEKKTEKKHDELIKINNLENTLTNDDMTNDEKSTNKKENENDKTNEIKIINPDEIDMKTIINLSQISTFTKNICLYVKITRKFPIKYFYNKVMGKECSLLSFNLMDISGNEMQATIYGNVISKFAPFLEEGNIYYIKGGYAKFNDKKYSNIKTDYRLTFDFNTQIVQVNKDLDKYFEKNEKINKLNIIKFIDLNNCKQNQIINCLGYILQIFPVFTKSSRIGNVLMRKILICDSSFYKVQFTLWNKFTELDLKQGNILLLHNVRVSNYNNSICLTTIDNSTIDINPTNINDDNCKEYNDLKKIIDQGINEDNFKYISELNSDNNISNSKYKSLGNNNIIYIKELMNDLNNKLNNNPSKNEISEFFTIKATVLEFDHSSKNYYYGCPNKICRKKLIKKDNDYFCPGCETIINDLEYYYILNLKVIDASGEYALNLFDDQVTNLFGIDAKTYSNLIEKNDDEKLKEITNNIEYHCFYFNGKANITKYGTRTKIQLFVYKLEKEDFKIEKKRIFNDIQKILNNIK